MMKVRQRRGLGDHGEDDEESEAVDASSSSSTETMTTTARRPIARTLPSQKSSPNKSEESGKNSSSQTRSGNNSSTAVSSSKSQHQSSPSSASNNSSKSVKEEKEEPRNSSPASSNSGSTSTSTGSVMTTAASQPAALRSAMGRTRSMRMRQQQKQQQQQEKQDLDSNNNNSNKDNDNDSKVNKSSTGGGGGAPSPASSSLATSSTTQQQQRRVRFELSNNNNSNHTSIKSKNGANHDIPQGREKKNVKTNNFVANQDIKQSQRTGDHGEENSSLNTASSSSSSSSTSSSSVLKKNPNKNSASDNGVVTENSNNDIKPNFAMLQQRPPKRPVKVNGNHKDDDVAVQTKATSRRPPKALFSTSTASTTSAAAAKQHHSVVSCKVMDIDAANNASRNQMLEDEVFDLCDSIRSSLTSNNNSNSININGSSMSCLDAAVELAFIVSVRKQRQVLFRKHFQMDTLVGSKNKITTTTTRTSASPLGRDWGSGGYGNSPSSPSRRRQRGSSRHDDNDDESHPRDDDDETDEISPLGAILDLLAWMTTRSTLTAADVAEEEEEEDDHEEKDEAAKDTAKNAESTAVATTAARTKTARASQEIAKGTDKITGKNASAVAAAPQVPLVWNVMAMIVHFLSLDCTLQPYDIEALGILPVTSSSSSSLVSASPSRKKLLDSIRAFRHAVLSHASGLQGMLLLVLQETSLAHSTTARRKLCSFGGSLPGSPCSVAGSAGARRSSPLVSSVLLASGGPLARHQNNNNNSIAYYGAGGSASVASSSSSSSPSLGSAGSSKKLDPTAAGRKRRRKMRLPLPTIDEGGMRSGGDNINVYNNAPSLFKRRRGPEKKKYMDKDDDDDEGDNMSFSLESPTPPPRSLVSVSQRHLQNFGADDFSSMASSTTSSVAADASSQAALEQGNETQEKLNRVISRVLESMPGEANDNQEKNDTKRSRGMPTKAAKSTEPNTASNDLRQRSTSLHLPLVALHRIVTGRIEGMERGCLDDDLQAVGVNPETEDDYDEDLDNTEHPQMITNRLLCESGVIPLLSQAMSETAMAITSQLKQPKASKTDSPCTSFGACISHFLKRFSLLRALVDDACSFNEANRKSICQEGYTVEAGGFLIVNLVSVLVALIETNSLFVDGGLGEIGFEVLRTLNGLAHENKVAAKELEMCLDYSKVVGASASDNYCSGLDVVARVLFLAVGETSSESEKSPDDTSSAVDKLVYDAKVFSLTILGNALESGASPRIFAEMKLCPKDGMNDSVNSMLFLPWLVKFLGNETRPFRDAVLGSTFGSSPSKHAERRLDQQEDEKLFTAGYGLTLVTSLLVGPMPSSSVNDHDKTTVDASHQVAMRELILPELPGEDEEAKLMFVKNTLKAFCNLYHFSVNEDLNLSMLVLAPIKKLLVELDRSMSEKIE